MKSNDSNFQTDSSDLDWRAFCYVTGELTESESLQFEADLATSQPLREAVARAVSGLQLIDSALATGVDAEQGQANKVVLPNRQTTQREISGDGIQRRRRSVGFVGSIVAALALLIGASFLVPSASSDASQEDLVAEAWVDSIDLTNEYAEFESEPMLEDGDFELSASDWLIDAIDESDVQGLDEFPESGVESPEELNEIEELVGESENV